MQCKQAKIFAGRTEMHPKFNRKNRWVGCGDGSESSDCIVLVVIEYRSNVHERTNQRLKRQDAEFMKEVKQNASRCNSAHAFECNPAFLQMFLEGIVST